MAIPSSAPQAPPTSAEALYHGAPMQAYYSDPVAEHQAVRTAAGIFNLPFRSIFSAQGSDRARFLHNMVTNDVKGLTPGRGVYATMLDLRGHILADLRIYCDENQFFVETDADLLEKVLATLGHYNIGSRVPLDPLSLGILSVQGPKAGALLARTLRADLPGPGELRNALVNGQWGGLRVIRSSITGEEGFELWAPPAAASPLREELLAAGSADGLLPCGSAALETLRIEAGIPVYGAELAEDTLPLEANLLNALSFTKGCYIGQEIVERARSRGHVNWKLAGLFVDSPQPPAPGEKLLREGKPIGEITSVCASPTLQRTIALGYVRREVAEPGNVLQLASGAKAEVTNLPFYQRAR